MAKAGLFAWFIARQRLITPSSAICAAPSTALTFLCAPVVDVIPVPTITGNITMAFSALSHAGGLNITVIADPALCPDVPAVAQALHEGRRCVDRLSDTTPCTVAPTHRTHTQRIHAFRSARASPKPPAGDARCTTDAPGHPKRRGRDQVPQHAARVRNDWHCKKVGLREVGWIHGRNFAGSFFFVRNVSGCSS
jgi:WS/DGAT C-terminal domain